MATASRAATGSREWFSRLTALAAILFLLIGTAAAQFEKGTVVGTVTDASGAVIVGATVTLTGVGTNSVRTATTDDSGSYTITNVSPGSYEVKASKSGFGEMKQTIQVAPGTRGTADIKLNAAAAATTVEVVAENPAVQVDTQSSSLNQVVNAKRVSELPSLTRDPYDFVQTLGNVSQDSSSGSGGKDEITRGAGVSINGQRSSSTDILMDGGENVDLYTTKVGQSVPLDAVQEFTVSTSNFSAEYGRAAGGVINVATKSGTNQFHGSLYEFNRVSALTSNDYDSNANGIPKQRYARNQFGYSLGGPIHKNKLFFFSSTEWQRVRSAATVIGLVMDPQFLAATAPATKSFFTKPLRSGMTQISTLNATQAAVSFNATTPLLAAYGSTKPIFDKVSYSVPSDSGGGAPQNAYNMMHRVDYQISDKTSLFGRYALFNQNEFAGFINNSPYAGYDTGQTNKNQNAMLSVTHIWATNVVSDSKLVFNRLTLQQPLAPGQPVQPTLYFSSNAKASVNGYLINLPGYSQLTPGNSIPFGGPQNVAEIAQAVSWLKSKHELRFGGQYVYTRDNRTFGAYENAVEALNGAPSLISNGLENLLAGSANWFQVVIDPQGKFPCVKNAAGVTVQTPDCTINLPVSQPTFARSNRFNDLAFYGQDNWKVTPTFTLNLGLRWEYYGVQHNKDPHLDSNFVFGSGSTYFDKIRNGRVYTEAATPNSPASPVGGLWEPQYHNFGPRVGFAWDVNGKGTTSIRGGYGIAYERNFGNVTFNVIQNVPGQFNSIFSPGGPITTSNVGPFAGTGTKALPNASLRYVRQDLPTAYTQMWNMAVQHQVMNRSVLALEYTGSHSIHQYTIENNNQAGFGVVYLGSDPVVNPLDRLNRQYSNMNTRGANGFGYYNALNTRFTSSDLFHQGIDLNVNYTWAHAIDNLSSTFSETPQAQGWLGLLDPFNPALDKGDADYDARHRVALSAVWALPYAKGTHGVVRQIFDGWELAPILVARTGNPFTVFDSNGYFAAGGDTIASRYVPSGAFSLSGTSTTSNATGPNTFTYSTLPGSNSYVDPLVGSGELPTCDMTTNSAGHQVSLGTNCHYPANMTRRNAFRQPGVYNFNLAIAKAFPISERFRLQFRSEFYNVLNHSNYYVQTGQADAGNYGTGVPFQIIGKKGVNPAAGVPNERRFVQLALRLSF